MTRNQTEKLEEALEREFHEAVLQNQRAAPILGENGWTLSNMREALLLAPEDANQRNSAACAFEQLRARKIVHDIYGDDKRRAHLVTFGNPKHRDFSDDANVEDIEIDFRHWRRGLENLARCGIPFRGFAVAELQECVPINWYPFIEPHWHGLIFGPTAQEVRSAFSFKVPPSIHLRARPLHVQPVTNLDGAIDYILKFRPTRRVQYTTIAGEQRWNPQRADSAGDAFVQLWYEFYAGHRISEMLTSVGDELHELRRIDSYPLAGEFVQRLPGWGKPGSCVL